MRTQRSSLSPAEPSRDGHPVLIGGVYDAVVTELLEFFGAIVAIGPGCEGLLHSSCMVGHRTAPGAELQLGQTVRVAVLARDRSGRFETTMRLDARAPSA